MAGDSVVGALRVVLGMDTAAFEDGAKKAAGHVDSFGKKVAAIATGIGLERGIEKFVESMVHSFKSAIEAADQLNKASQKFGIPVEQLSALSHVADLADVSMETLGKSFVILSKNMLSVAGDATNITAAAFSALNIKVKDANGNLKTSQQVFDAVADKFADMQDGASKTALAVAIFGRAGAEMIPILNLGSEGIKKQTDEFRKMGIVVSKETAESAEHLNDNLKLLGKTKDAIILKIVEGMLPSLDRLSERFVHAANDTEHLGAVGDKLGKTLEFIATWAGIAAKAIDILTLPIQALVAAGAKLVQGEFIGALKELTPNLGAIIDKFLVFISSIKDAVAPTDIYAETLKVMDEVLKNLDFSFGKIKDKGPLFSEKQFSEQKKFNDAINKLMLDTRVLRGDFAALTPGLIEQGQHFKDLAGFGEKFGTTLATLTPLQLQLNAARQAFLQQQVAQEVITPWDLFKKKMDELNATFPEGQRQMDAYQLKAMQLGATLQTAFGEIAKSIVSPIADAFKTLATMNKQYAGVAKAAAIAEALINTYLAATKAYASVPPPFNFAAAAAVTAAGLVNVAKIRATEFAQGGSFKVGGAGGIDSQLVGFKATPGEMVDVRTPGQQRGGSTEITVRGVAPDDMFTGKWLRGLVDALNVGDSDGYRLRFAER